MSQIHNRQEHAGKNVQPETAADLRRAIDRAGTELQEAEHNGEFDLEHIHRLQEVIASSKARLEELLRSPQRHT